MFTPPLRPLTPRTSEGFAVIKWCREALGFEFMPWQRHLLKAALELDEDGNLRFRTVLCLVARQNGKSTLINMLACYWLAHGVPLVLGTSSSLDSARESWELAVEVAEDNPEVFGKVRVSRVNGNHQLVVAQHRSRYKVASASRKGGRGLTIHRLITDELREHLDWTAWAAADNATTAVPSAQTWAMSNAGDDRSIVLNHFRHAALTGSIPSLGVWEWSAPEGCDLSDRAGWRQANPSLGTTITEAALESKLSQPAAIFRTENLCQSVPSLDEVVSPDAWANCLDPSDLSAHRSRVTTCLDISPDLQHATLCAAAVMPDGRCRVEVVQAWTSTMQLRRDLPALLKRVNPRLVGWFPSGPAAAMSVDLKQFKRTRELTGPETSAACMSLAEYAAAGRIAHSGDELLAAHVLSSRRAASGDGWRFSRRDGGHCDAAFAAAGAVFLARSLPAPSSMRLITT